MEEYRLIEFVIGIIIQNAPAYHLKIDGDPSKKYFILRDAHLAPYFSTNSCDILFKFGTDGRLAIFFPEHITISFEVCPHVCPLFFEEDTCVQGWQRVCPHLTEMVHDIRFEYIPVLMQFVQNPALCGIDGCDWRVCYLKQMGDFCWELPWENKEKFEYEQNIKETDTEKK
jgi:hypothetical protein